MPPQNYDNPRNESIYAERLQSDTLKAEITLGRMLSGAGPNKISIHTYRNQLKKAEKRALSFEDSLKLAAAESLALQVRNPSLTRVDPRFGTTYRLYRTLELQRALPRDAKTLFVGSGLSSVEVAAMHILPPEEDFVELALEPGFWLNADHKKRVLGDPSMLPVGTTPPNFYMTHALTIDPVVPSESAAELATIQQTAGMFTHLQLRYEDALGAIAEYQPEVVVMNRAEPKAYMGTPDLSKGTQVLTPDFIAFLESIKDRTVLMSIGTGNITTTDYSAMMQRLQFMELSAERLRSTGRKVTHRELLIERKKGFASFLGHSDKPFNFTHACFGNASDQVAYLITH
jgi:hypothetical protein